MRVAFFWARVSKAGMDREQVRQLYEQYGSWVFNRAKGLLRNEEMAWEVVQEVFLKVMEVGNAFRGESSPWTWIYRITTNYCLNLIRRNKTWKQVSETLARQQLTLASNNDGGSQAVLINRASFVKLLEGEDQKTQGIILAYYKDDLTQEEIKTMLGISRKTIGRKIAKFEEKASQSLREERL